MVALLSWINWVDRAATVITASTQAGNLGPRRVANPQMRAFWRTEPGTVTPQIDFDFGSTREIGVVALGQPDNAGGINADGEAIGWMASTDTVRHRLDAVTAGAGTLLDTTAIAGGWATGYGLHAYQAASPISARYWRCNLNAASLAVTPGWIDLGRAWAGPAWQPARGNISYGWGQAFTDGSNVDRNPRSGLEFVSQGPRARVLTFGFQSLNSADAERIKELQRIAGIGGQILFVPAPGDALQPTQAIIGRLAEVQPITQPYFSTFAVTFQIRQSL